MGAFMQFDERDLYTGLAALHWATISETDSRRDMDERRYRLYEGDELVEEEIH